jgi:predicted transposase YdaD
MVVLLWLTRRQGEETTNLADASDSGQRTRRRRRRQPADSAQPAKLVDGFAKQLIALAPTFWAEWVTQQTGLRPDPPLDPEFRLVFRQSDTLLPVTDAAGRRFIILFELQYLLDMEMPWRVNAYCAVAEQRYRLPVFAVVVNFQPPPAGMVVPSVFESECFGLRVRREYRVINLWEVPALAAFEPEAAAALLVLLPFLDGGESVPLLERALTELRRRAHPPDLELFLLYLVQKVGGDEALRQLGARLDMAMLRKTAWFDEIIQEGLQEGRQQGLQEGRQEGLRQAIRRVLAERFDEVPPEIGRALDSRTGEELEALLTDALRVSSLAEFQARLDAAD